MQHFTTIQNEELATITGGQSLNNVPGAWRPNRGMGRPPSPMGNPIEGWDRSAAAAEAERRRRNSGGGGGSGMGGRIQRLQPWM
jgi:bacteriocin-like protein